MIGKFAEYWQKLQNMNLASASEINRNLMIIGCTGAGKSSLINFLCNGNMVKVSSDATHSCTKGITKISLSNLNINLFDSPGFGDLEALSDAAIFAMVIQEICTNTENKSLDGIVIV
jgi:ribosome biogenesis GTPase A